MYFAGFDFEAADHQHYWEHKMKNATCHNMRGEASALQQMVEQGLIHRLMPAPPVRAPQPACVWHRGGGYLCTLGVSRRLRQL